MKNSVFAIGHSYIKQK